jgi:hypothetical protein
MPKLNETSRRSPKDGGDGSDGGSPKPSSLVRLSDLTRRVLNVPKSDVAKVEERNRQPLGPESSG